MKLILLGPPGAGKGTQAEILNKKLNIPTISTGNILRAAVKNGTPVGLQAKAYMDAGKLVPDEVIIGVISERLAEADCQNGFILDGVPRTIPQAEALEKAGITFDAVVSLEISDEEIVERMGGREVNKRTLENFIKAGAMDSLPGNRRQKTMIAPELLDQKNKDRKNVLEGQLSLFDFAAEEEKQQYQITMPKVPEFPKGELLAFEKETLGIYVSGHPMDEYLETWKNSITAKTTDFMVDEETGRAVVEDGARATIGGMITARTVKLTKNGQQMAFVTLEDMVGSVEVIVFPRDYENKKQLLNEDAKVFISGRTSIGDDPAGRLICEQVIPFDEVPKDLWLKFADKTEYDARWPEVTEILRGSDGHDTVIIYLEKERAKKVLPANWHVAASTEVTEKLMKIIGEKNVKVVEKGLKR